MFRKIISVVMTVILMLALLTSCGSGEGKDLYYPLYADPISFDPQIASDNASKIVVFNCFEGLVRVDAGGKIIPGVAKSWTISDDGLTYVFKLRKEAKWYMSDYAKELLDEDIAENFNYRVTADDFVYGLRRAFNADMGTSTDMGLYVIKNAYEVYNKEKDYSELGVTAVDEGTLKIELETPNDDFLKALTQSAAMPCRQEFFEATKGRYGLDPEKVIYNGPFYLYSWTTGVNLVLNRNENYSGEKTVKPSSIFLYINDNLSTRVDKIKDGTYDACPLSVRQKVLLDGEKKISYVGYNNSTWGFCINCSGDITGNEKMRQALACAVNLTDIELPPHCEKYAEGIVPEICVAGDAPYRDYTGNINNQGVDREKARQLFSQALKDLEMDYTQLTIICPENFENIVKLAVQSWQSILGVDMSFIIETLDEMELEKRITDNNFEIAFTKVTAQNESAVTFLGMFSSGSANNIFNYKSDSYDALMSTTSDTLSQSEIMHNCLTAEKQLMDCAAFIPMFNEDSFLAMAKGVQGIYCVEAGTIPIFIDGIRK